MTHPSSRPAAPARPLASLVVGVVPVLILTAVLALFVWPGLRLAPRGLEVAVVGPAAVADGYARALDRADPDAFQVLAVPDLEAARSAVRERDVRGALVPGPEPRVLVASADGTAVAQVLTGLARSLPGTGPATAVEDVVPLPPADPRGTAQSSGLLPVVLAGLALGAALAQREDGPLTRLLAVTVGALASGAAAALTLHVWLGATGGSWWGTAAPVALAVAATGLVVLGLAAALGTAGLGAGAAVCVLLGNPLSGATSSPALLPSGWSALGQLLPPGATATLLRGATGFGWAGTARPLSVLCLWCLVGTALLLITDLRRPSGRSASAGAEGRADHAPGGRGTPVPAG